MARCFPERTVDSWFASALTRQFPSAGLWSPAPCSRGLWDHSGRVGAKAVVFECKGNEERTRRIDIDRDQLQRYIRIGIGHLVFYVLPSPPWTSAQLPLTPTVADGWRTFERWSYVLPAYDLEIALAADPKLGSRKDARLYPRPHPGTFKIGGDGKVLTADRLDRFFADLFDCHWVKPWSPRKGLPGAGKRPNGDPLIKPRVPGPRGDDENVEDSDLAELIPGLVAWIPVSQDS